MGWVGDEFETGLGTDRDRGEMMRVIHVLRKPCSESPVALNVLKHGTGAINIAASRVRNAFGNNFDAWRSGEGREDRPDAHQQPSAKIQSGRWPANMVFQHHPDCRQTGVREEPGYTINRFQDGMKPFGEGAGHSYTGVTTPPSFAPVWECAPGCPVAALDERSGDLHARGNVNPSTGGGAKGATFWLPKISHEHHLRPELCDTGGASRYFKQFAGVCGNAMPPEFAAYLRGMISPEERVSDCVYLHIDAPDTFGWAPIPPESVHGMVIESGSVETQPHWIPEAYRVLKPGAHLMLVAPMDELIGDTGACIAEDIGFEVRDAILWVTQGTVHYVPKASRSEREAGLVHLAARNVTIDDGEEPDTVSVKNFHPTVKPIAVMASLIEDLPPGLILDPFLGSGTTLLACLDLKRDAIGIERGPDYLGIADARVRHRDREFAAWDAAAIVSDHVPPQAEPTPEISIDDFLGL